jgi:hypothetical protein
MNQAYISFFDASEVLKNKFGASPSKEEFWMWCSLGKNLDGVDAYEKIFGVYSAISSGAIGLPTRTSDETGHPTYHLDDVIRQLKSWYFLSSDIEIFEPKERFITGYQLHERWTKLLKGEDEATEYIKDYSIGLLSISPESPSPALINWFPAGNGSIYSLNDIQLLEQHCHMPEQQAEAVSDAGSNEKKPFKLQKQQEAILKVIKDKSFDPMTIPDNEKRAIKIICESNYLELFKAESAFDRAWKKGIKVLWKMEYHESYARRGNN